MVIASKKQATSGYTVAFAFHGDIWHSFNIITKKSKHKTNLDHLTSRM